MYEHTLSTYKPLRFVEGKHGEKPKLVGPDDKHSNDEYNQIKYVEGARSCDATTICTVLSIYTPTKYACRQLYQETASLETKLIRLGYSVDILQIPARRASSACFLRQLRLGRVPDSTTYC